MNRYRLCNTGLFSSHLKDCLGSFCGHGLTFNRPRKKQVGGSVTFPVKSEQFEVFMG